MNTNSIKNINYLLIVGILITYFALTGWDNFFAAILLFLFTMSPLVINVIVVFFAKTRVSQIVLLCSTIAYAAWAYWIIADVKSSADGQAGFTLFLIAITALPVLIIAWIACLVIEVIDRKRQKVGNDLITA